MEGPILFWGYKKQESNIILPEHDDDDENLTYEPLNFFTKVYWDICDLQL